MFPMECFAAGLIGEIAGALRWRPLIAPWETASISALRRIFPFLLGGKPVGSPGVALRRLSIKPVAEGLRILVADVDRRLIVPIEIESPVRGNMMVGMEPSKLSIGHLIHRHEKALLSLQRMAILIGLMFGIAGERTDGDAVFRSGDSQQTHLD